MGRNGSGWILVNPMVVGGGFRRLFILNQVVGGGFRRLFILIH